MNTNKSKRQTFERVGIYLRTPLFSHGKLCRIFLSPITILGKNNIRIQTEDTERQRKIESKSDKLFTINCVYRGIYGDQLYFESQKKFAKLFKFFH